MTATKDNAISAITDSLNQLKATLNQRTFPNSTSESAENKAIDAGLSAITSAINAIDYSIPATIPPTTTNPGGKVSGPVVLKSNTTYQGLTIDLGKTSATAFSGSNVSNVTIKNCKIINGINTATAIYITGGSNINISGNFISNIPQGIVIKNTTGNVVIDGNQFLNILNTPSTTMHPIQFQGVNGVGNKITNNRIEEIASIAPYTHDQISIYQSNGTQSDPIEVAFNWIRGGQIIKNAAGNNGACALGIGDSGGSWQSVHDNIMVNALAIAIDGSGKNLHVFNNQIFAKQVQPQPLSVGIVYFGSAGNNVVELNQINFTTPNGQKNNLNPAFSSVKGWVTNIVNAKIDASILPAKIITFQ